MPTPFPPIDIFGPLPQAIKYEFEERYLSGRGLDVEEASVNREYRRHGKRTLVRCLTSSTLSGDWGIGDTQEEVGEFLGVDHSCISEALNKGEMSSDSIVALLFSEERPEGWLSQNVFDTMNRSGFIAGCRHMSSYVHDRPTLVATAFDELSHELICGLFRASLRWAEALCSGELAIRAAARAIVNDACLEPGREVIPSSYRKEQAARATARVQTLLSSDVEAAKCLLELHRNWYDICTVTTFTTAIGVRFSRFGRPAKFGNPKA